jgi:PQQ-dependent dehydrogenase (methanol/ethanol family)
VRPGDNKWASSVFARDVDTGEAKWAMQTTPHDEWDYDATNEVILFDRKDKHGKTKTYATQVNKNGFIYTWQANNGTLIAAKKVHPFVNWATSVDLKTGVPAKDAKYNTHQDYNAKGICPTVWGAKGLAPASYSYTSGFIYVPLNATCMAIEPLSIEYTSGKPWVGVNGFTTYPSLIDVDARGAISAINPLTGKIAWVKKEKFSLSSGLLSTATHVLFYGSLDGWLKVVNANRGTKLWQFKLGSGIVGNPFSYSKNGKQYVGVYSGFGGWAQVARMLHYCSPTDTCYHGGRIEGLNNTTPPGGGLNIFSL